MRYIFFCRESTISLRITSAKVKIVDVLLTAGVRLRLFILRGKCVRLSYIIELRGISRRNPLLFFDSDNGNSTFKLPNCVISCACKGPLSEKSVEVPPVHQRRP